MAYGVPGQTLGEEYVESAVRQLRDGGPDGRSPDSVVQQSMADVDEGGFAERLGDVVADRPQPVVFGDQRAQLIDVGDTELVGIRRREVGRRCQVVEAANGPNGEIVRRPGQCCDVGDRKAKQQLVIGDAAVYVVAVSRLVSA